MIAKGGNLGRFMTNGRQWKGNQTRDGMLWNDPDDCKHFFIHFILIVLLIGALYGFVLLLKFLVKICMKRILVKPRSSDEDYVVPPQQVYYYVDNDMEQINPNLL